jgi:Plasmid pRiA4b ORF-3-like protein.
MIEPVARLRITLQDIQPAIWRRVDAPLSSTLMALHDIIQVAMGWTDSHLFEFIVSDRVYGEPHPDDEMYERKVYLRRASA